MRPVVSQPSLLGALSVVSRRGHLEGACLQGTTHGHGTLIRVPMRPLQPQVMGEQEEALQTPLLLPPALGTKPGTRWVLNKVCRMKCSEAVSLKCLQFASGGDKGENYKLPPTQHLLKL